MTSRPGDPGRSDTAPGAELLELAAMATKFGRQDLREALTSVTETGVNLTGAEYGAFFYSGEDEHGGRLDVYVLSGESPDSFPAHVPVRHTALFAPTFSGHGVVRVADVTLDPRYGGNASAGVPGTHAAVRSYLAVPVVTPEDRVLGALLFGHSRPGRFDEGAEVAARAVAAHAASAAENARLLGAAHRALEQADEARREAERSTRRLGLLQEITAQLSTTATSAEVQASVPSAVTRSLGCAGSHLLLLDEEGEVLVGELMPAVAEAVGAPAGVPLATDLPSTRAVRTGVPALVRGQELQSMAGLRGHDLRGVRAVLAVPLLDQGRHPLGVLSAAWHDEDAVNQDVADLLLAVAGQTGQALQRTRLFDAEQEARAQLSESVDALTDLARTLQHDLLPRRVPELARVGVAVRYQPAVSGAEVGGDWYDVVPGEDGAVTFVIGDVQGHSTTAAGLMGQLRSAVRAYVTEGHDPATALTRTNAMLQQSDSELFATCCLVRLDQRTGEAVAVTAGHPAPLVLDDDGYVRELDVVPGVPLGVLEDPVYTPRPLRLRERTRVLMYTDGVVESSGHDWERGLSAVRRAAAAHRFSPCDVIADEVMAGIPHRLTDDAAVLVLDYAGPSSRRDEVITDLATDLGAVADARRFLRETLCGWDVGEATTDNAELITSELVTNAVTHTGTAVELAITRAPDTRRLCVSVTDRSTRHPAPRDADEDAVGGRGLAIVDVLAEAWGVTDRGDGKVVWAQVPLS